MRLKNETIYFMKTTTTLNTGAPIPLVGMGTWRMHEATYSSVLTALKAGYTHIDTAMIYRNEEAVGQAIADSGVTRDKLFITTKLWNDDHGDVAGALSLSLKKLNLDYVDLYLIHWPLPSRVDAYKEMEKLQASGKAKAIGVSNFTVRHLEQLLPHISIVPAVNQVEFNPFLNQAELLAYCREKGIVLEAYCPLAHGSKLDDSRLVELAEKYGRSAAQLMLRWAVQQGIVVIPKSSSPERIAENLKIFDFDISSEDMSTIATWNENSRICGDPTNMP
jgi:diketogulonate reductase-like aldo/keto reductase